MASTTTFTVPFVPPRPAPLRISKTCVYKTVGHIKLLIDLYLPAGDHDLSKAPLMLFVHGGGWMGSNRSDYCRPMFQYFLDLNFIVASMDYRLVPESSHLHQLEDVKDVEYWLRSRLPSELGDIVSAPSPRKIVVSGASAGAQIALMTPKLWEIPPVALLSMYGPTDMSRLPYSHRGRLSGIVIEPCSPELLQAATDFENPPTQISIPLTRSDYTRPRGIMAMHIFRNSLIAELLLRGLTKENNGSLKLPDPGCLSQRELDDISPLAISRKLKFPSTYQIMGTNDEIFDISHMHDFHDSLERNGVKCERVAVPGMTHAFDMGLEIGSSVCEDIIRPAVVWLANEAGVWESTIGKVDDAE